MNLTLILDQVLFEGQLLKYKPGTSFNWVERWCRVTKSEFKYYKNQWTASCADLKPLVSVPIHEIVAIFRVNLDLPKNPAQNQQNKKELTSIKTKYKELFQFEVFTEQSEYPYKDELNESDSGNEEGQPEQDKVRTADLVDLAHMDGFRLWNQYQEKKLHESPENARKKVIFLMFNIHILFRAIL